MSNRFLAIDIKSDLITAVAFTVDAKAMQIVGHAVIPAAGRRLEEALAELGRKLECGDATSHIALEADSFFFRNLSLPFTDSKTISKILPLELEEQTHVKTERLLIDSIITGEEPQKSRIIAAMVDREVLAARLATLKEMGIDPQTITVSGIPTTLHLTHTPETPADFLLLDINLQRATLILVLASRIALIRPLVFDPGVACGFELTQDNSVHVFRPEHMAGAFEAFCTTVRQTLHSVFLARGLAVYLSGPVGCWPESGGRIRSGLGDLCLDIAVADKDDPVQITPPAETPWDAALMGNAVNLGLQSIRGWKGFNFRKEAFATRKSFTANRTLALAIVLPLLSVALGAIFYIWYDYTRLLKEQKALTSRIHAVFAETLPDITRIVDPIQQLEVKIRETRQSSMDKDGTLPSATILTILAEISAHIPPSLDVRLARFVVDDTGLRLKGTTDTFNTVDAIKKGLETSPAFSSVEISAANLDPKSSKIRFELKLTMKGV